MCMLHLHILCYAMMLASHAFQYGIAAIPATNQLQLAVQMQEWIVDIQRCALQLAAPV